MKFLIPLFCLFIVSFISLDSYGQHEIHKKTGEILLVKIIEIGLDEIKYQDPIDESILRVIDKDVVKKIVLNGREEDIQTGFDNSEFYADQKKRAIKLNFFSPLSNYYVEAGFEKSIRPGMSMDFSIGFIGVGNNPGRLDFNRNSDNYNPDLVIEADDESAAGSFVRAGVKFINTPSFYTRGMRYSHILKGGYLKPELQFGAFGFNETVRNTNTGESTSRNRGDSYGGLFLNIGKQWVYSDIFLVDISYGLGYGFSSNSDYLSHYSMWIVDRSNNAVGLGQRFSLNVGVLIK